MKNIIALALLLSCFCVQAADHIINWAFNPTDQLIMGYCVYEQIGGVWQRRADVPGSINTVTLSSVTPGTHTYALQATNSISISPLGPPVIAPGVPVNATSPTNVIVILRASVESSKDAGEHWQELVALSLPIETSAPTELLRTRQEIYR
jgi:hypothetical protein